MANVLEYKYIIEKDCKVMLENYLKIAWRYLWKSRVFSLVNIVGLAIGLMAGLLIFQYVSFELSYDQFHKYKNDTYRVSLNLYKNGALETQSARVSPAVASALKNEFAAIDTYTRLVILGPDGVLTYGDQYTGESSILLADSAFFDVFSFPLLSGNRKTAFNDPFCVVITESTAKKLFKDEDPLGKNVVINAKNFDRTSFDFKVTGIIADFPENSHLRPGVLISYPTLFSFVGHRFDNSWQWNETYTYFRLQPNTNPKKIQAGFPTVVHRLNKQLEEQQLDWQYQLQPITDIHLKSDLQHELSANGNALYVYFLAVMGILILVIAFFNFINLTTLKALQRGKEIGVRKISGAHRRQLIVQIFIEALLLNGIAILAGVVLSLLVKPYFSGLFDVSLLPLSNANPYLWVGFGVFILLLVLGSSFYPAFILSRYEPARVLKSNFSKRKYGMTLRKVFVTSQFGIALIMIAVTLISWMQVRFMQEQSLGFIPEQVVVIQAPKAYDYGYGNNYSGFKNKVSSLSFIKNVSGSNVVPGQEIYWYSEQVTVNGESTSGVYSMAAVSPGYFKLYDIPLVAGRLFFDESKDQNSWIINETALRLLGFEDADKAIGSRLNNGEIIGVVKDYHQESLKTAIKPTLFNCGEEFNYYTVKIGTDGVAKTLTEIKSAYEELFPGSPYNYFFLDDFFNRQYKSEQLFNTLFRLFSALAIFITCLGLFGLSFYTVIIRTKEIGIRKVMGASERNIVSLLSAGSVQLIFVASLPALPIAYLVMQKWLENYATRITIEWWLLAVPIAVLLIVSVLTVGLQTFKAATKNPVKALRYE